MRIIFTTLILLITNFIFAQNTFLPDSILGYSWNPQAETWEWQLTEAFGYNTDNKIWHYDYWELQNNSTYNQRKRTTYDDEGNISLEEFYHYSSGAWNIYRKAVYTREISNDSIIETINYYYYSLDWESDTRIINQKNTDGQLLSQIELNANKDFQGNLIFRPWNKNEYSYDNNGNTIEIIQYGVDFQTDTFELGRKFSYLYDADNHRVRSQFNVWNSDLAVWENRSYVDYIYFNGQKIEQSVYSWGNGWQLTDKEIYTYENDLLVEKHFYYWVSSLGLLLETGKVELIYDENGKVMEELTSLFTGSAYLNYDKKIYKYINTEDIKFNGTSIAIPTYPNPTVDNFTLEIPKELEDSEAILFNAQGQWIQQYQINDTRPVFSIGHLEKGVYFLKIVKGNLSSTVQIVKI